MSNAIRYDPLLVRRLADELRARLLGRGCAASPIFAADRSATLALQGGEELRFDLHPSRGYIRVLPAAEGDLSLSAHIEAVDAPPDERLLTIRIAGGGRFVHQTREFVLELHTNQWNALVVGEDGRTVSVLHARRSGNRSLEPGSPYHPPASESRIGATGEVDRDEARRLWQSIIMGAAPPERVRALISRFAYTGAINANWILEPAADDPATGADRSFERWWWIHGIPEPAPTILRVGGRSQPYPVALTGIPGDPVPSLLDAMARVVDDAAGATMEGTPNRDGGGAADFVGAGLDAARRRLARLRDEFAETRGASELREKGDLLLARLHQVPRGAASVRLEGWSGETVEFGIDPTLTPAENAERLYEEARRRERAGSKLPDLIEAAERDLDRWYAASHSIAAGEVPDWVATRMQARDATPSTAAARQTGAALPPYRLFRTSGGLEVRVGRGAKENDRLTFRESTPNDVWLHARSVPGSHVILRWTDADAAPPSRDLSEAAQLAAVFSRARTSSVVPVDWTRRKHVRKPRGATPGLVIPQRVRTVFVEPDPAIVDRLKVTD